MGAECWEMPLQHKLRQCQSNECTVPKRQLRQASVPRTDALLLRTRPHRYDCDRAFAASPPAPAAVAARSPRRQWRRSGLRMRRTRTLRRQPHRLRQICERGAVPSVLCRQPQVRRLPDQPLRLRRLRLLRVWPLLLRRSEGLRHLPAHPPRPAVPRRLSRLPQGCGRRGRWRLRVHQHVPT